MIQNGMQCPVEKLGIDAKGRYFYIKKVAEHMKSNFITMSRAYPLMPNIRLECPIPVGMHKETVQALCDEFRNIFSDANVVYNADFNAFFFDFM